MNGSDCDNERVVQSASKGQVCIKGWPPRLNKVKYLARRPIEGKLFKPVRKTYNSAELFVRITSVRKNEKT